jgi:hypothetical protein
MESPFGKRKTRRSAWLSAIRRVPLIGNVPTIKPDELSIEYIISVRIATWLKAGKLNA